MKARKILVSVAALALVAAISIGGTLAYLTSQATVTNTFSVGNIKITLDEAQLDKDGMNLLNKDNKVVTDVALAARTNENTYKLMPGHTYVKDPTIHVEAKSEDSYIFVKVVNGISGLEATGNTTIAEQLKNNGWTPLMDDNNTAVADVYVYAKNGAKGYTMAEMTAWLETYAAQVRPYVADTGRYLRQAQAEGKAILFEGQLGALRDLDYGIYPYTTSSNTIAAYAPIGAGLPTAKIDQVVGVVKAYSSCVGEGPFTCEWFGADAEKLREAGAEYGAKTGRPRRVGPIDLVATRYGVEVQGATNIALTKLDILSYMNEVPVCAAYEIDGEITHEFPFPAVLERAKPVMEYLPGWGCDISGVRTWADMPQAARDYVEYVEQAIGCHIGYVSVGAERESLIIR